VGIILSWRIAHLWASWQTDTSLCLNLYLLGERYWSHLCCVQVESSFLSGFIHWWWFTQTINTGNCVYSPTPLGSCSILYRKVWICCIANIPRNWKSEFSFSDVMRWRVQWLSHLSSKAGQGLISSRAGDPWLNLAHRLGEPSRLNFLLIRLFCFIGTLILFCF